MLRDEGIRRMGASYGVIRNSEIIARYCNVLCRSREAGDHGKERKEPAGTVVAR